MSQWNCPFCKQANNDLEEAENIIDLLLSLPEWTIYGSYDTPRCLWCGGFKHREPAGHKKNCKRQKAIEYQERIKQNEKLHQ